MQWNRLQRLVPVAKLVAVVTSRFGYCFMKLLDEDGIQRLGRLYAFFTVFCARDN